MESRINKDPQLKSGIELDGEIASYEIIGSIGRGAFGETYRAKITKIGNKSELGCLKCDQEVVIKIPTLDPDRPLHERVERLAAVLKMFIYEYTGLTRLRGLQCVAQVLDSGLYPFQLDTKRNLSTPTPFIVQELIEGQRLDDYMESNFPSKQNHSFIGIPKGEIFFEWARNLTRHVIEIHQRQVVHGDIWPENIMVDPSGAPIFIDFGQALFRDLVVAHLGMTKGTHTYVAPEGSGTVSADVYSLGGVLFYLATGQDPPRNIKDIEELKNKISSDIKKINPPLYDENCGVADIIARCLRFNQHERTPHAEGVLRDIETFSRGVEAFSIDIENLNQHLNRLRGGNNSLFSFMVNLQIRGLQRVVEDMTHGVYDLIGDHEDIVSGLTQYLSFLSEGDQYLTVSIPSFWYSRNLGINGRFLAMNKIVAQRGATIRRIFLITSEERANEEVKKIISSHIRVIKEISDLGVQTDDWDFKLGGYFSSFKIIEKVKREEILLKGKHFGLLVKDGQEVLVAPIYRDDETIVAIQFRAASDLVVSLRRSFDDLLKESTPLPQYVINNI